MSPASPRRAGNSDWSPLASLVLAGLVLLFLYKWWNNPEPAPKPPVAPLVPQPAAIVPRRPPVGIGGTYRGVRIGGTIDDDLNVGVDLGVGSGPFGAGVTVIRFSLKDGSYAFVPDDPNVSVEIVNRTLTWSYTDGLGKQIGLSAPVTGRLIFDVNTNLSTSPALGRGELTLSDNSWSFQPLGQAGSQASLATKDLPLDLTKPRLTQIKLPTPPHVYQLSESGLYLPSKGYVWQDGTSLPRSRIRGLEVKWSPGSPSHFPPHLHAAATEGEWEPDAGYVWPDQTRTPQAAVSFLAMAVQWAAGLPSPSDPNVVSSDAEGKWRPAPGYTWASSEDTDLRVVPLPPE